MKIKRLIALVIAAMMLLSACSGGLGDSGDDGDGTDRTHQNGTSKPSGGNEDDGGSGGAAEREHILKLDPYNALIGGNLPGMKLGYFIGIQKDGSVKLWMPEEYKTKMPGIAAVEGWTDMVKIIVANQFVVGLRCDGTVLCVLTKTGEEDETTAEWDNVVDVIAYSYTDTMSDSVVAALRSDGTVVCRGLKVDKKDSDGNYESISFKKEEWTNIVKISCDIGSLLGLRADGTVIACGNNNMNQCETGTWTDVVDICAGRSSNSALKSDGTLIRTNRDSKEPEVSEEGVAGIFPNYVGGYEVLMKNGFVDRNDDPRWTDIVKLYYNGDVLVGRKSDGSVIASRLNDPAYSSFDMSVIENEPDILEVFRTDHCFLAIRPDGTPIITGTWGEENEVIPVIQSWNLFDSDDLAEFAARRNAVLEGTN